MGCQSALKGDHKELKAQVKRIHKARAAAAADIERILVETKVPCHAPALGSAPAPTPN